jgi:hypothetical protein
MRPSVHCGSNLKLNARALPKSCILAPSPFALGKIASRAMFRSISEKAL